MRAGFFISFAIALQLDKHMNVQRRNVFYLSGFDPRGIHYYHALYRTEAAKYASLSHQEIIVSNRHATGWSAENRTARVSTDITFLKWDDIVRRAWIRSPLRLLRHTLAMYAYYAKQFQWQEATKLSRAPLVTFAYPLLSLLLLPLVLSLFCSVFLPWWAAILLAAPISVLALRHLKSLWLMRFFVFNHQLAQEKDTALMERLDQFADNIVARLHEPVEETLLVGHSNGSILMVYLLDKIAARLQAPWPKHMRVLTLGHCIPLISYLKTAPAMHRALKRVASIPLYWCDIGFPPDGACYAGTNPFLPGVTEQNTDLHLLSARFFRYYEPQRYRTLRRNKYQLHFRYLMTGDSLSPLDYTALTTNAAPLPQTVTACESAR